MSEMKEDVHRHNLILGTLNVGEAESQMRRKRHTVEDRKEITPTLDENDETGKNRWSLVDDRNQNVAHLAGKITEYQEKSFAEQFFPIAKDLRALLRACADYITKGRMDEMYRTISDRSYQYLTSNPDF